MFLRGGRKPVFHSFPGDQQGNSVLLLILVKSWRHVPDAKVTNNNINLVCYYLLLTSGVTNT